MATDISQSDARRVDFLLADFGNLKEEISRRSGLQERALALYFAVIAYAVIQAGSHQPIVVAGTWGAAWLTLVYYVREDLMIARLASVIRHRISEPASALLGPQAQAKDLIPSEWPECDPAKDRPARAYDRYFMWVSFGALPLAMSGVALVRLWMAGVMALPLAELLRTHAEGMFYGVASVAAACAVARLLWKKFRGSTANSGEAMASQEALGSGSSGTGSPMNPKITRMAE